MLFTFMNAKSCLKQVKSDSIFIKSNSGNTATLNRKNQYSQLKVHSDSI